MEAIAVLTQLQDLTLGCVSVNWAGHENGAYDWSGWRERLIPTLAGLVGLRRLDLSYIEMDTVEWCSALTNLRCLRAAGNRFEFLESLPSCPMLTELDMSNNRNLTSLVGLSGCPNLTKLCLSQSVSISSLEPIQACSKLRDLTLYGCNVPGLEYLRNLPGLHIEGP